MAREVKIKYNAVKVTIEAVIPTQENASEDVADSVTRGLEELYSLGMAKVVKVEPCEYPEYDEFYKDKLTHLEYGNGRVSVRID